VLREGRFRTRVVGELLGVRIVVRAKFAAPPIAIQRLGEVLRGELPADWSSEATPTTVALSAPELKLSPDQQGHSGEVVVRIAKAKEIVQAACDGRDDIRPHYFAVDPASVQRRSRIDAN